MERELVLVLVAGASIVITEVVIPRASHRSAPSFCRIATRNIAISPLGILQIVTKAMSHYPLLFRTQPCTYGSNMNYQRITGTPESVVILSMC